MGLHIMQQEPSNRQKQQYDQLLQSNQQLAQQLQQQTLLTQQLSARLETVSNSDLILQDIESKRQTLAVEAQQVEASKQALTAKEQALDIKEQELAAARQDAEAKQEEMTTAYNKRLAELDARKTSLDERAASIDATIVTAVADRTADLQRRTDVAEAKAAEAINTANQQARHQLQTLTDVARRDYKLADKALTAARKAKADGYQKGLDEASAAIKQTQEATAKALATAKKAQAEGYQHGMEQAALANNYRDCALIVYASLIAMVCIGMSDYYRYDLSAAIRSIAGIIIYLNDFVRSGIKHVLTIAVSVVHSEPLSARQTTAKSLVEIIMYLGLLCLLARLAGRRIGTLIDRVYMIVSNNLLSIAIIWPLLIATSELARPHLPFNSLWLHIPVIVTTLWIRHKILH